MRSLRKTPVAVVREELGLSLQEFADLIGKSAATVSSLENGRLRLSERTALAICKKTGVSLTWLLAGDPTFPPVNAKGGLWAKEDYETQSGEVFKSFGEFTGTMANTFTHFYAIMLEAILAKQIRDDPDRAIIILVRSEQFLKDLRDEFGADDQLITELLPKARKMQLAQIFEEVSSLFPAKTSSVEPSPSSERRASGRKSA
jgi:transcriptional regulator with XRE-family HTH domain